MKTFRKSLGIALTSLVVGLFAFQATAQTPPPPAAKAAPAQPKATKAPAAKTKTTASVCKGLEQKACSAKTECGWIAATKRKDGKQVKAYCRTKPASSAAKKG
jgi:hypothetical protein